MWSDSEAGRHHESDTAICSSLVSRRESVPSLHSRIPDNPGQALSCEERRLLWIDDEKSPSDPDVRFLTREGFHIDGHVIHVNHRNAPMQGGCADTANSGGGASLMNSDWSNGNAIGSASSKYNEADVRQMRLHRNTGP